MRKITIALILLCTTIMCFQGLGFATNNILSNPEQTISVELTERYFVATNGELPEGTFSADEIEKRNNAIRKFNLNDSYAIRNDFHSAVELVYQANALGEEDLTDFNDMTDAEFDTMIDYWLSPENGMNAVDASEFVAGNQRFLRYVLEEDETNCIYYRTNYKGDLYSIKYLFFGDISDYQNIGNAAAEADEIAKTVKIDPTGIEPTVSEEPAKEDEIQSNKNDIVSIPQYSLTFKLPNYFWGITQGDNLSQIPKQYKSLFEQMQPLMASSGVAYYAVREEPNDGSITQFSISEKGAIPGTLQQFFSNGNDILDTMFPERTNLNRGKADYPTNQKYAYNDLTFDKKYYYGGDYSWLAFVPVRADVPFVFSGASGDNGITSAVEEDIQLAIESLQALTTTGEKIPGNTSATDLARQQYEADRSKLICVILLAAFIFASIMTFVQYKKNADMILLEKERNRRIVRSLLEYKEHGIITNDEYEDKKSELQKRETI